jgi:hypothetical protein
MKKTILMITVTAVAYIFASQPTLAEQPSAFGSGFDVQDFYQPFALKDITPNNQQKWPYYKHVSAHWDDFALHGTKKVSASKNQAKLEVTEERLDLNLEYQNGISYIDSFVETQVKGFVVMKDNKILAEYYDNGFNVGDTNLLQSAAKSFAGIITHKLVDKGLLDPKAKVSKYLKDFEGTSVGAATVQQVLDMLSGMPTLLDFHTPGATGQLFEVEQGLQPGKAKGHRETIKSTKATKKPGEAWQYCDMNTDTLALLSEQASGKNFSELLSELFHQWIAQGKAPESYYDSVKDPSKTKFGEDEIAQSTFPGVSYGSQSYYIHEDDVIFSSGSFGQNGYSDLMTGVAVVFLSDWAVNWEVDKGLDNRYRAIAIINHLRASTSSYLRDL